MLTETIAKLISSGWNDDDVYNGKGYKSNGFDFQYNNYNKEEPRLELNDLDFDGQDILQKFFFLMIGGVFVFIILVIIFKCCVNKTDTVSTAASNRHNNYYRNDDGYGHGTTLIVPDIVTHRDETLELTQLVDLPPSYDASTQNSRCNSTQDLRDSGAPEPCRADDAAPPSYLDVCGSDTAYTSETGVCGSDTVNASDANVCGSDTVTASYADMCGSDTATASDAGVCGSDTAYTSEACGSCDTYE